MIRTVFASALVLGLSAQADAQTFGGTQAENVEQRIKDAVRLIEQMDPSEFVLPESATTLHFALSDGGLGALAQSQMGPGKNKGAFMLEATSGAAFIQDFRPTGGPDCDPDTEEPLIIYYGFFADADASVMSVNQVARLGAIVATGHSVRYRPGPTGEDHDRDRSQRRGRSAIHLWTAEFAVGSGWLASADMTAIADRVQGGVPRETVGANS